MSRRQSLSRKQASKFGVPSFRELAGGTITAEFDTGFDVNIWGAHGRNDRFYTGKPIDTRHEGRSFGPESRRELQRVALVHFLGAEADRYNLHVDKDGDVVATRA